MDCLQEFDSLMQAECLGFYNCCEVVTAFIEDKSAKKIYNFITMFVMEERFLVDQKPRWLSDKPVKLSERFNMGCQKKLVNLECARESYCRLSEVSLNSTVNIGDGELTVGRFRQLKKVFVPQDSTQTSELNKVLKNNFRNGSYIMEFFDEEKPVRELLGRKLTQKAAEELYRLLPVDLFTVSDRIGNCIFQFPSTTVRLSYHEDEKQENLSYRIELDSRLAGGEKKQNYQLFAENPLDHNIIGFGSRTVEASGTVDLYFGDTVGLCTTRLVDLSTGLIVSEMTGNLIRGVHMRMHMGSQFGKEREIYNDDGELTAELSISSGDTVRVGDRGRQEWKKLIQERQYKLRMEELDRRREFIQYGLSGITERERALRDIRELMNRGDGKDVYLWDPYLSAQDLLDTWYYTTTSGMRLRCITSAAGHDKEGSSVHRWMEEQRLRLENGSNQYGICMEFRCQWGNYGYGFHDRFLMIVDSEGKSESEVWSLGASVNSLGTQHHIIQKVLHPQPIVDAFETLWDMLVPEHCLVWEHGR